MSLEPLTSKILSIGAALTTILVISGSVTDPVNAPKLVVIGVMGAAALAVAFSTGIKEFYRHNKLEIVFSLFFIFSMFASITFSKSPFSQNLFGSYGRNNGFITYLFLVAIFLAALSLKSLKEFTRIVWALLWAGVINIVYCLWVIIFGDFIGWSNPYGNILGTLGNPNFIGSFLGIFFSAYLAYMLKSSTSKLAKTSILLVLPVTFFEIFKSHAIQGRVVAALGVGIIGFLWVRSKFNMAITGAYLAAVMSTGFIALLGALQIGPLTQFIYKNSVSLRGQYWLAGWNTGESHPLTGVGMDSFGDWYRRSRDIHALELPGVNTVVNAAHNVPLDMFAFGGWPLFLSYLAIVILAGTAAVRVVIRNKKFDPIFAVFVTSWAGYQLQSIISINQIGLAIWGWLLSGILIAYEKAGRNSLEPDTDRLKRVSRLKNSNVYSPSTVIIGTLSGILGLVIALPPFVSDTKLRSAQLARSVQAIEATMQPSFFNPQNAYKYINNIQVLEASNLFDLSHKYPLEADAWNCESFDVWNLLYLLKNSTTE